MPTVLDLFCGGGGAGMGYHQAGFDVIGVDIAEMPLYPFPFYRGDVFKILPDLLKMNDIAGIHASPPCQHYLPLSQKRDEHPDLVGPTRDLLNETGLPWIMENIRLSPLQHPTLLCGSTFDLGCDFAGEWWQLQRHRYFEASFPMFSPGPCKHTKPVVGVYGKPGGGDRRRSVVKMPATAGWQEAMGINWLGQKVITQSIPPAYTEFLGKQLASYLALVAV